MAMDRSSSLSQQGFKLALSQDPPHPNVPFPKGDPNPPDHGDDDEPLVRNNKRARVAVACNRCKARKQKCDGSQPCSKCRTHNHECEYVMPQRPMPFSKDQYINALEQRVADLETLLAAQGAAELSSDHWGANGMNALMAMPQPAVSGSVRGAAAGNNHGARSSISSHANTQAQLGSSPDSEADNRGIQTKSAEAILDWQEGVDTVVSVLRSLSLDINGSGYIGGSSHVALGRLLSFLDRGHDREDPSGGQGRDQRYSSAASASVVSGSIEADVQDTISLQEVPDAMAERLFDGYIKHISNRWPIVHTVWIRNLHDRRHELDNVYDKTILHLVYATAGRFIETTGETGPFNFKAHYASAVRSIDTILSVSDIRSIQVLMLRAAYCLRDPAGAGAWTFSRTALLIAIDQGLHRQTRAMSRVCMENELRKRLLWACYVFDRQISIPLGRPLGISDREIDIQLPLDIDEDTTEDQMANVRVGTKTKSTSLTSFVLTVRLRQIESDIQQTIYRVDDGRAVEDSVIDDFLERLAKWKEMIPEGTDTFTDSGAIPYDGWELYMVYYYKVQHLLLYPQICKKDVSVRFLKECASACAGVCAAYKSLHQSLAVGYSLMTLQTIFMAGLTLVYCLWISPQDIFDATTNNGIRDCSIMLFVIAERIPAAKKYCNAFETIHQRVIDQISRCPEPKSRQVVAGLTADLNGSGPNAQDFSFSSPSLLMGPSTAILSQMPFPVENGRFEEYSQIIMDMAGNEFASNYFGMTSNGSTPFNGDNHPGNSTFDY